MRLLRPAIITAVTQDSFQHVELAYDDLRIAFARLQAIRCSDRDRWKPAKQMMDAALAQLRGCIATFKTVSRNPTTRSARNLRRLQLPDADADNWKAPHLSARYS